MNKLRYIFLLFLFMDFASADMTLDRSIVIFDTDVNGSNNQREDVTVINTSETDNMYVNVELFHVEAPGTDGQRLVNPREINDQTFIVTPSKLMVPPGEKKLVRLMNLGGVPGQEKVYRINFTPVVPPVTESQELDRGNGSKIKTGVQIVVAYQVLAIVLPEERTEELDVERKGNLAVFENRGNTNVLLYDGSQCNPVNEGECQKLTGFRLYPGNKREIVLPFDSSFTFSQRNHNGVATLETE